MSSLAITIGEPAGIGPEILLSAWLARKAHDLPAFYALADPSLLAARVKQLNLDVPLVETSPAQSAAHFDSALPVVPLKNALTDAPGVPSIENAAGVIEAITRAVDDALSGNAAGIVTCPIAKKPLYDAGFSFPGHTEFLGHLAQQATGQPTSQVMMMAGPDLRTVPVTVHQSLASVPASLTREAIETTGRIVARELATRFGIERPRLAVSGLNPHAGEGGALGTEDDSIVAPAVARLQDEGFDAVGPLPADTMFHLAARRKYDAALCMYHDQALIPVKALAFDETVNVTLGLPFIRTSPDHGTAFDIAGQGVASPASLIAAINLAQELADNAARKSK